MRRVMVRGSGTPELSRLAAVAVEKAGFELAENAGLVLAVNGPAAPAEASNDSRDRDLSGFVATLLGDSLRGRTIAVADVAPTERREEALEDALAGLGVEAVAHEHGADPVTVIERALRALGG